LKFLHFMMPLCLVFLVAPVLADDELIPEPLDQAIGEYKNLKKSNDIDPMNHEVWKLYVFYDLTPESGFDKTPKWFVTALTPDKHYRVVISINQLYNFIQPRPQPGDVIVVEGRVSAHYDMTVDFNHGLTSKRVTIPAFLMNVDGAVKLKEHFEIQSLHKPTQMTGGIMTPTPGGPGAGLTNDPKIQLSPTPTPGGPRH